MSGGPVRLGRQPVGGLQLVSAGLPDGLLCRADGSVWWWCAAGLFSWEGDLCDESVLWWPIGAVSDAIDTPAGVLGLVEGEPDAEVALVGAQGVAVGALPGVAVEQVSLGAGQVVIRQAGRNRVEALGERPVERLSLGARLGRLAVWPDARGSSWVDGGVLYRRPDGGPTRTAGSHPPRLTGMVAGPRGATVLLTEDGARLIAPRARPVDWARPVEDLCFSPDGSHALLDDGGAVHAVALDSGAIEHTWEGPHVVAGFRPRPTCLDLTTGDLVDDRGERLALGLRPWATARVGDTLYGPRGAAWDLASGTGRWEHPALNAEALAADPGGVVAVCGDALTELSPDGRVISRGEVPPELRDEDRPASLVARRGDRLLWTDGERWWSTRAQGTWLEVEPGPPEPMPEAGGVHRAGGRQWTWTASGLLLALPD